jgi:uncharacterized cupin superfamily protein
VIDRTDDWSVTHVRDASWFGNPSFGSAAAFDPQRRHPHTSINLFVLEPGKPNCLYHRENAQEDFLVLSGRCTALVNGEKRELRTWDLLHCGPGVDHVLIGTDAPCAVLAIGHKHPNHEVFYPESPEARARGAESPEPTTDPRVAYRDAGRREPVAACRWPIDD